MFYSLLRHFSNFFGKKVQESSERLNFKCFFFIASLSACMGIGLLMKFEEIERRRKFQHQELMNAVNRFYSIIRLINFDTEQVDTMIQNYEKNFIHIYQKISEILPVQAQSIVASSPKISNESTEVDLDELKKIYEQSVLIYPKLPNLKNMSAHAIHAVCDEFEEYHEKVKEYSIFFIGKNAEQLTKYEKMLADSQKLFNSK
jgi:hypothetical protein